MKENLTADIAIVGAGIIGLAHAYLAARAGLRVAVFERNSAPVGASLRNFGMIWPIGQPAGEPHRVALRSHTIWLEALREAGLPHRDTGSIHAAYSPDEAAVGREFAQKAPELGYDCSWLSAEEALARSSALHSDGLEGGLWSSTEFTVDPRQVLREFPAFLHRVYGVRFHWNTPVHSVEEGLLESPCHRCRAAHIVVAGGDDFQTLYPDLFQQAGVTRCKLQMMRTVPQRGDWLLGPSLAFGLTFLHYPPFAICDSLESLRQRVEREMPDFVRYGIHVLVSQANSGELILGDSHKYGLTVDIFDSLEIYRLILDYASRRLRAPSLEIAEQWHGVYAKHPSQPWLIFEPSEHVRILTVTSGIGMTMSFGLAEQILHHLGVLA